jgi:cell division protein FtsW
LVGLAGRVRPPRIRPVPRGTARDLPTGRVVQGPVRERHEPDYLVLVVTAALAAVGLLMITSSRGVESALLDQGNVFGAITQQVLGLGVGVLVLLVMMSLDYRVLRLASVPAYLLALLLLLLVLLPPLGPIEPVEVGGAVRWLRIGGLPTFHPAELAKLALIVYLAHWFARRGLDVRTVRHGTLPFLVICGLAIALVALEPDLGTTGVFTLVAFTMFFVAGGRILHLALLVPVGVAAVALYMQDYQMDRIHTWLDPWSVAGGLGYQTVQGLLALASGGLLGRGLGESGQPGAVDVPNADNDFIFAVVGQEFGLAGGLIVIGLFLLLAWRGIRVAMGAPDTFGALVAFGITAWLAFQAFINIGVVTTLLPLTGIPLPFVSAGATSLVVSFAAVGILLSISRETVPRESLSHADPDRGRGDRGTHLPRPGRAGRAG